MDDGSTTLDLDSLTMWCFRTRATAFVAVCRCARAVGIYLLLVDILCRQFWRLTSSDVVLIGLYSVFETLSIVVLLPGIFEGGLISLREIGDATTVSLKDEIGHVSCESRRA